MYELRDDDKRALANLKLAAELVQEHGVENAWKYTQWRHDSGEIWDCRAQTSFNPMTGVEYTRKKRTHTVNNIECPAPETEAPAHGTEYFIPYADGINMYEKFRWTNNTSDKTKLEARCIFLSPEDAAANTLAIWPKLKDEIK